MIELKVTVEDDNQVDGLLHELHGRKGVTAKVSPRDYEINDESQSPSASEAVASYGVTVDADFSNNATHFFDGENLYVTRRYYEDYIRDMAYNFAHPEAQKNEPLRTISDEELSKCLTLDEFRDELTEMIHKHYHPEV